MEIIDYSLYQLYKLNSSILEFNLYSWYKE
jgi:hypothetical protein